MNLNQLEDEMDWKENQRWPWRFSPAEMITLLVVTLAAVAVLGLLVGG